MRLRSSRGQKVRPRHAASRTHKRNGVLGPEFRRALYMVGQFLALPPIEGARVPKKSEIERAAYAIGYALGQASRRPGRRRTKGGRNV